MRHRQSPGFGGFLPKLYVGCNWDTISGGQLAHLCKSRSPDIYFLGSRMWKNLKPSLSVICRMKGNRLSLCDLMIQSYASLGHGNLSVPSRYTEKVSCDRDVRL